MTDNTDDDTPTGADDRPLGLRLRLVDALISREFATALHEAGVGRREWMVLNVLAGEVDVPGVAERIQRGGKRLRFLAERGWAEEQDGTWVLTDEGRAAHERLSGVVTGIREKVAGAVSPEDYATMTASLDAIAAALGADEADAAGAGVGPFGGRGFGRGRGFGPFGPGVGGFGPFGGFGGFGPFGRRGFGGRGFGGPGFRPGSGPWQGADDSDAAEDAERRGPGFGPGRGFGPGPGFGPGRGFGHGHGGHCGHGGPHHRGHEGGHGRGERGSQKAYERGFDAGYSRGRESADA